MKKALLVIVGIAVLLGGYVWVTYNKLVVAGEGIDNQWAQVETQYQRRFDLIPNLVASVKGVLQQEQKVFGDLADARTRYSGAGSVDERAQAATQVESALARLLVIIESYPQLWSSETVQTLMTQLEGTENRISVERGRYNDAVRGLNTTLKTVPAKWVAALFGFSARNYFEAAVGAESAPSVDLTN